MPTQSSEVHRMSETLGEVKGQLREVIHTMNNMAQKVDALTEKVIKGADAPTKVTALEVRVTALETERNRRDGATGVIASMMKSPAVGWLVGAAVTAWAMLTGRMHV
jgi:GTPase